MSNLWKWFRDAVRTAIEWALALLRRRPPIAADCTMPRAVNRYVQVQSQAHETLEKLVEKSLHDFRSGRHLADIADDLKALDLATDMHVRWLRELPEDHHDAIHSAILGYIDKSPRWTVLFDHEPEGSLGYRIEEDEERRQATIVFVGDHRRR